MGKFQHDFRLREPSRERSDREFEARHEEPEETLAALD